MTQELEDRRARRAGRHLRTLIEFAKTNQVYSLGIDLQGKHADVVCIKMNGGGMAGDVLVPIAKLLTREDAEALQQTFGALLDSENVGHS